MKKKKMRNNYELKIHKLSNSLNKKNTNKIQTINLKRLVKKKKIQ